MNGPFEFGLFFSDSVIERLGWVLIHSLWQFALIALLAAVALRVMRRNSAEARSYALISLMALAIVLPVVTWMLQPEMTAAIASAPTIGGADQESTISDAPSLNDWIINEKNSDEQKFDEVERRAATVPASSIGAEAAPLSNPANTSVDPVAAVVSQSWTQQTRAILRPWLVWMVGAWGIGVLLCLLRPLLGWRTLRRLKKIGVSTPSAKVLASFARVSEQMGFQRRVVVLKSSLAQVPMVIGYLRPVILLPISLLTEIPATQLELILVHELAHIRRHDFVVNLLQILIETLFFYHPAVWWLSHRIRVEREHCCDDVVVKIMDNRSEYGRALIAIEELRGRNSVLSLGATDGSLLQRVRRITLHTDAETGFFSACTSLCLIASLVSVLFFISLLGKSGVAAMDENHRRTDPHPAQSSDLDDVETASRTPTDELEFLATYPKLQELSLGMTEQQFLAIVQRNKLKIRTTNVSGGNHYWIPADDNHSVIVMFGNIGGKCSGIQRIRADNRPTDVRTLREPAFRLPGHSNMVCVGFDNNDAELVAVSTYQFATIRRWDLVGKKLNSDVLLSGDKHLRPFRDGTFKLSGDGRRVVAATDDYVGIWNTATGELLHKLSFPTKEWEYDCIAKVDCTPDLSVIVGHLTTSYSRTTMVYDARLIIWDDVSGDAGRIITDKNGTELQAIDLSTDGKLLVTTGGGGAKIWETSTGTLIRTIPNDNSGRKDADFRKKPGSNNVWSVQFSPNGKQLAVGDVLGIKLWDTQSGELLHQLDAPYRYGLPEFVFSKDGRMLARIRSEVTGKGKVVPIWSTQTGQQLFEIYTESVSAAFSDDGKRFAVGLSDREIAIAVWQLEGQAANEDLGYEPVPEPLKDKMGAGSQYRGKQAEEFINRWKPTWSETQLGFQMGLALTTPQRQFRAGQRVPLAVFFRNVGDKPQQLDLRPDFHWKTPKVVNANGEEIEFEKVALLGSTWHYRDELQPGEAFGPFYLNFGLGDNPRPGKQHWSPYYKKPAIGKYSLTHTLSINVADPDEGDRSLKEEWKPGDIESGTIEFEIVGEDKAATHEPMEKRTAATIENQTIALADSVRDFNAKNKQLGQGLDQPPLTEDEVIAAIKQSEWKRDAKRVSQREFASFKAVAESRRLPQDSYIEVWLTEEPTPFTVIHKWEIRLFMPAQDSDGFVHFTVRNKKREEQNIEPESVAWGPPDADGLSLGLFLLPRKDEYKIGDRVTLRLFVRNDGRKAVENMTFQNITWPGPKDFTVTDQTGAEIAIRNCHEEWSGAAWIAGAMGGSLFSGDVHGFRIPFELAIGGDQPNELVGRVVDAQPGQNLRIKLRAHNGSHRIRSANEPVPETGSLTIKVAEN